jgi:hypothetical protein
VRRIILVSHTLLFLGLALSSNAQDMTIQGRVARNGGKPLQITPIVDTQPIPLADLSTGATELVVVGKLVKLKSYLSDNRFDVFTDYELVPKQVIVDRAGHMTPKTPGPAPALIVKIRGGELVVDGTRVTVEISSLIKWDDDSDLLLFLARDHDKMKFLLNGGPAGLFKVERRTRRVTSLLNHPKSNEDLRGGTLGQIVQRVKAATP